MNPNDKHEKFQVELTTGEMLSYGLAGDVEEMFAEKNALKKLRKKARKSKSKPLVPEEPAQVIPLLKETEIEACLKNEALEKNGLLDTQAFQLSPVIDVKTSSTPQAAPPVKARETEEFSDRWDYYQNLSYPVMTYQDLFKHLKSIFSRSENPLAKSKTTQSEA